MLPFLMTIVVLMFSAREALRKRIGAPAALMIPFVREER
jgi:simple sugar transport system permease protein